MTRTVSRLAISLLALAVASQAVPAAAACKGTDGYAADFGGRSTYIWRPEVLEAVKAEIAHDPASVPAYAKLIAEADADLTRGPWSVVTKTRMPPSGNIHDYTSLAPYWWPDPHGHNGEPYFRKDGEVDPERSTNAYDEPALQAMSDAVTALGLAYYYSGDRKYADRAAVILRAWFLDAKTRMNPNVDFGQMVPGVSPGRKEGVIDVSRLAPVVDVIGLLQPSGALTGDDMTGLRKWFGDLTHWMQNTSIAIDERSSKNNHAVHYDLQLIDFATFSGQPDVAIKALKAFPQARINTQIKPDGSMPEELARTRSLHYSATNLSAMYDIATLGECYGIDLWSYKTSDGRGLPQATAFLAGYAGHEQDWKWQEITGATEELYEALLKAADGYHDPALNAKAAVYNDRFANSQLNLTTRMPSK